MDRQELDSNTIDKLRLLQVELESAQKDASDAGYRAALAKSAIADLNTRYIFPVTDNKSEIFERVKVIRVDGSYGLDFKKFIEIFGWDIFRECFDIEKASLRVEAWTEKVRNEEVKEDDLLPCITEPRDLKPRVGLVKDKESNDE